MPTAPNPCLTHKMYPANEDKLYQEQYNIHIYKKEH